MTDITVLLDRSGSMASTKTDVIGGFNQFVSDQAKQPDAVLSLIQFDSDDPFEVIHSAKAISAVPALNASTFQPRGSTPLLDAIGKAINETGRRIGAMAEQDRPSKVLLVIVTDGQENASHEFTKAKINEMIALQRGTYSWEFVFMGANQDAICEAGAIGIVSDSSLTYVPNAAGVKAAFMSVSAQTTNYRSGLTSAVSFTADDRKKQKASGLN